MNFTRRRYAVKIYYDGKNFSGFQQQKNLRTISGEIISALQRSKLIDNPREACFKAASRTDRGVSALGQTIAFTTDKKFTLGRLNAFLPKDIRCWAWAETHLKFNPRKEAKERIYLYVHTYSGENIQAMRRASEIILRRYVYGVYHYHGKIYYRKLSKIRILRKENHIFLYFHSKSFIRKQVRRLTSLLLKIGAGVIDLDQLSLLFEEREQAQMKHSLAPPENLTLLEIKYNFKFDSDKVWRERLANKFKADIREAQLKKIYLKKISGV